MKSTLYTHTVFSTELGAVKSGMRKDAERKAAEGVPASVIILLAGIPL